VREEGLTEDGWQRLYQWQAAREKAPDVAFLILPM
jgi:hypothetical protein